MTCFKLPGVMKSQVIAVYLNDLNDLNMRMKIFSIVQEAGVLPPLETRTQQQMSVKW
jgi:hypothetical protein